MTESPKLSERIFHMCTHLMGDQDITNEEVVRRVTSWLQNTEVKDRGIFSQVFKYVVLALLFCFQGADSMVSRMVIGMDIGTAIAGLSVY